jgi:uncharacterized membrane protein YcjF (UPF0283 family)
MNRNASRDGENDISEDFEQLVGNKGGQQGDASDASASINVQDMNQQQMRQQMMQQQQQQQQREHMAQAQQPQSDKNEEPVRVSVVNEIKENFSFSDPTKILTAVCVLFALFFVFSSSQLTNGLNGIGFVKNLPFAEQSNLVIRGLLFVTIYMLLDRFVL